MRRLLTARVVGWSQAEDRCAEAEHAASAARLEASEARAQAAAADGAAQRAQRDAAALQVCAPRFASAPWDPLRGHKRRRRAEFGVAGMQSFAACCSWWWQDALREVQREAGSLDAERRQLKLALQGSKVRPRGTRDVTPAPFCLSPSPPSSLPPSLLLSLSSAACCVAQPSLHCWRRGGALGVHRGCRSEAILGAAAAAAAQPDATLACSGWRACCCCCCCCCCCSAHCFVGLRRMPWCAQGELQRSVLDVAALLSATASSASRWCGCCCCARRASWSACCLSATRRWCRRAGTWTTCAPPWACCTCASSTARPTGHRCAAASLPPRGQRAQTRPPLSPQGQAILPVLEVHRTRFSARHLLRPPSPPLTATRARTGGRPQGAAGRHPGQLARPQPAPRRLCSRRRPRRRPLAQPAAVGAALCHSGGRQARRRRGRCGLRVRASTHSTAHAARSFAGTRRPGVRGARRGLLGPFC